MNPAPTYIVDSDVFITAKNRYYSFDICPGFWDSLLQHSESGQVFSLDRIRQELLAGSDDDQIVAWVKNEVPAEFFLSTHDQEIVSAYTDIMVWVQRNPQFLDNAKAKFATEADGWLVAYAQLTGTVVTTNEQPSPEARNRVPLPNVCEQFGVRYDTFAMLRTLGVRYENAA